LTAIQQNAVEYRHLGTATGALNSFKSIGGAFGAAIFNAILTGTMGFSPTLTRQGRGPEY
jgi:hypothetical protein